MTQRVGGPKKIGKGDITGALGVNIIERRLLEMGYLWYPSGGVEAGIDGRLEIRVESGEVTNLVVSVQSKATDCPFQAETLTHFSFGCSDRCSPDQKHGIDMLESSVEGGGEGEVATDGFDVGG